MHQEFQSRLLLLINQPGKCSWMVLKKNIQDGWEKLYNGTTKAFYQSSTNKVATFTLSSAGMHLRVGGANSNYLLKTTKKLNATEIKEQGQRLTKDLWRVEIDGKQVIISLRLSGRLERHSSHLGAGSLRRWHQVRPQQSFRLVGLLLFLLLLDRMWARAATAPTGKTALPVWIK